VLLSWYKDVWYRMCLYDDKDEKHKKQKMRFRGVLEGSMEGLKGGGEGLEKDMMGLHVLRRVRYGR